MSRQIRDTKQPSVASWTNGAKLLIIMLLLTCFVLMLSGCVQEAHHKPNNSTTSNYQITTERLDVRSPTINTQVTDLEQNAEEIIAQALDISTYDEADSGQAKHYCSALLNVLNRYNQPLPKIVSAATIPYYSGEYSLLLPHVPFSLKLICENDAEIIVTILNPSAEETTALVQLYSNPMSIEYEDNPDYTSLDDYYETYSEQSNLAQIAALLSESNYPEAKEEYAEIYAKAMLKALYYNQTIPAQADTIRLIPYPAELKVFPRQTPEIPVAVEINDVNGHCIVIAVSHPSIRNRWDRVTSITYDGHLIFQERARSG